jgi:iron(III) transport system permease protein
MQFKQSVLNIKNTKPEVVWGWIIAILLFFLVLTPILFIIYGSLVFDATGPRMIKEAREGAFTLFNWVRVTTGSLSKRLFYEPALHSVTVAIGMTAISLLGGSLFAWLVARTNLPYKKFFSTVLVIPYIVPSWTVAMAWISVFKSEQYGGTPGFLNAVFGLKLSPMDYYGIYQWLFPLGTLSPILLYHDESAF